MCASIYRLNSEKSSKVALPVVRRYLPTMRQLLWDLDNVRLIPIYQRYLEDQTKTLSLLHSKFGYENLKLGVFTGEFFKDDKVRLDESFYKDANIDLEKRWSEFRQPPTSKNEALVRKVLHNSSTPFIFLHEDKERKFLIDRRLLRPDLPIIEPNLDPKRFTIFDYRSLIAAASEVHVIESSFGFMIDVMPPVNQKLYIHRYARPEANMFYQNMVGYKRSWHVFNNT